MYDTLQTHTINTYNHMLTWQPPCKGDVRIINISQKREQTQWGVLTHSRSLCQGSTNHPKFSDLLGGLTGLHMSIQSYARLRFIQGGDTKQNRQRKRHMGKMWRKLSASFQELSPVKSHNVCFIPPIVTTPVKCGLLGKFSRDAVHRVFVGGLVT